MGSTNKFNRTQMIYLWVLFKGSQVNEFKREFYRKSIYLFIYLKNKDKRQIIKFILQKRIHLKQTT